MPTDADLLTELAPAAGITSAQASAVYASSPTAGSDCEKLKQLLIVALAALRACRQLHANDGSGGGV